MRSASPVTLLPYREHGWRKNESCTLHGLASARGGRIVIGLGLIVLGLDVGGVIGWVIAIAGLLPVSLGVINGCIRSPFLKVPFKGSDPPPR
jgi:hypothetical protein